MILINKTYIETKCALTVLSNNNKYGIFINLKLGNIYLFYLSLYPEHMKHVDKNAYY